jgi:hypothetical protein
MNFSIPNWKPTREDLRCLSISASKLYNQKLKFERLKVKSEKAKEIFKSVHVRIINSFRKRKKEKIAIFSIFLVIIAFKKIIIKFKKKTNTVK